MGKHAFDPSEAWAKLPLRFKIIFGLLFLALALNYHLIIRPVLWVFRTAREHPKRIVLGITTVVIFCVVFNLVVFRFFLNPTTELRTSDRFFFNLTALTFYVTHGKQETIDAMGVVMENAPSGWTTKNICTWHERHQIKPLTKYCDGNSVTVEGRP